MGNSGTDVSRLRTGKQERTVANTRVLLKSDTTKDKIYILFDSRHKEV